MLQIFQFQRARAAEPKKVFEGTVAQYLETHGKLRSPKVDRVVITGIGAGVPAFIEQSSAIESYFGHFIKIAASNGVTELDLYQCNITQQLGFVLGKELSDKNRLEPLPFRQLTLHTYFLSAHLAYLLADLKDNRSLTEIHLVGGNVKTDWNIKNITALANLLRTNTTLERIYLPNSYITKPELIEVIEEVYRTSDRPLAEVSGLRETIFSNAQQMKACEMQNEMERTIIGNNI